MYWGLVCLYTGSHIFNPPGDQQMSSRKELLYLLEQFIPAGILFVHYMSPQLKRNRLQVCSAMNMCILRLMYSFIYLFVFFFNIWSCHTLQTNTFGISPHYKTDLHTGTRRCAFILSTQVSQHSCLNAHAHHTHTHLLRVPCHLHPSACSE